ncbi:MAG TPA: GAF domain-containing protein [Salinimicrobium sp.]|nr:GAF domain-containing protein [Salinimicrobium sp.]
MPFEQLKPKVKEILNAGEASVDLRLSEVCELLRGEVMYYNWVGFYFKNGDRDELKLRSFAGEPTDHIIIPFGRGICGQVALSNENFVVPDVAAQDNYIACSIDVKAEIVIPLFKNGENIGQIDIDSHTADPFTERDEEFLVWVNQQVSKIL